MTKVESEPESFDVAQAHAELLEKIKNAPQFPEVQRQLADLERWKFAVPSAQPTFTSLNGTRDPDGDTS